MTVDWVCACDAPLDCTPAPAGAGIVLLGVMDGTIHAVSVHDGTRLWETRLGRLSLPSIQCADEHTVVAAAGVKARGRGVVAMLRAADGAIQWSWNAPGTVNGPMALARSTVLCASIIQRSSEVTCIELGRRRPVWRAAFDAWVTGIRVDGDAVFAPCMDHRMYCLGLATGERRWAFAAHGLVCALPLVHRGALYFGAHDAVFYAIDPDGRLLWRTELADRMSGAAAADDDLIIFGGWDNHVRALDAATGKERWAHDAEAPIVATPVVAGGRVYIGTDGGQLLALDTRTGRRLDVFPRGEPLAREIKKAPLIVDDRLIVAAQDGAAYALRLP